MGDGQRPAGEVGGAEGQTLAPGALHQIGDGLRGDGPSYVFDQGGAPGLQVGRGRLLGPVGLHPGLAGREVGHGQGQVGPGADVFQAQERQQGVAEGELQGVPELPDSPLQARRIGRFHGGVDHDQGGQAHLPPLG